MQTTPSRLQLQYIETTPEFWALRGRKVRIEMPASINERVRGGGDLAETGRSR